MKARVVIGIVILVVIAAIGLTISAWRMQPDILEIYPVPGVENVPSSSPVRLVFSAPMRSDSVIQRLKIEPPVDGSFTWDQNTLIFIPHIAWPGGEEIRVQLEAGAKAENWLAFPMGGQNWTFTTSESHLAYLWPSDGPAELYALNPETGDVQQLTHGLGVLEYSASTDGSKIYFSAGNSQGGSDLYELDRMQAAALASTYRPGQLLDCGLAQCRSPAVSYDGKYLAYEYLESAPEGGLNSAQIWMLGLSTSTSSAVGEATHETVQPAWSSSGWLAYYDRTSSNYEMINPQTQARLEFPNQTGQPGSWSSDGQSYLAPEITYQPSALNTETATSHLMRYDLQSKAADDLSPADVVEDVGGTYSPDGLWITFTRKFLDEKRWSLGRQIWVMSSGGSDPHPITDAPDYNHYDLAWSRDSRKIAYVRFNQAKLSDPPELWMMNADGSEPIELVVGGYSPVWMP
ncbi:MAG TPA: Ig-like domain-containing protein [Anaerolineales bacterium]